jgi:hypothetical protein
MRLSWIIWLVIGVLNTSFFLTAEQTQKKVEVIHTPHFSSDTLILEANKPVLIQLKRNFSSILVKSLTSNFSEISIKTQFDSVLLKISSNEDIELPHGFWIPRGKTDKIWIKSSASGKFIFNYFFADEVQLPSPDMMKKTSPCEIPNFISYDLWRTGLPDPKPGRIATRVRHCIVHHSAGNNNDTNYLNIVRNIYLLHTEANGWDDIGYNFLIAPNGMVFGGRDPQGEAEIDNTQGAHFCSKNAGTMGICLLGNYDLVAPNKIIIDRLEDVITWKLYKERLTVDQSFPHPDANGSNLGTVAMHQNGCNTACPGKFVRDIFPQIKDSITIKLATCNQVVAVETNPVLQKQLFKVYPNPSNGRFFVMLEHKSKLHHYRILNAQGKEVENGILSENGYIQTRIASGFYFLIIQTDGFEPIRHRIVIQ